MKISNISMKYSASDENYALRDVNLMIQPGEKLAVIGANGAGKSTLLLLLCGVLSPISGEISIEEIKVEKKNLSTIRQSVGMVFQNPDDQLFMPSIYEDIAFGLRNYGFSESEIELKVNSVLNRLGISHLKNRMSHKLSSGEKRLVALAGILVMEPFVLLMDEPSAFLDPRARRRLIEILVDLPHTMIVATHDLDMALDLCDRAILLKEGCLYADDTSEKLLHNSSLLKECDLELPLSLQR